APGSTLWVVSLASGATVRILPDFAVAREAVWAPNGQALLLLGRSNSTAPLAQSLDWWWVPLDGRPPVRTGALDMRDFRAATNNNEISLGPWSESGVLFSERGTLWSLPLSPASGRVTGPLRQLASGAGRYLDPAISRDGQVVFAMSAAERV